MSEDKDVQLVAQFQKQYQELNAEIGKVIVGQKEVIDLVLISIFSKGHCLLVGVPGLAKTLLVSTIAESLGLDFNRIQTHGTMDVGGEVVILYRILADSHVGVESVACL